MDKTTTEFFNYAQKPFTSTRKISRTVYHNNSLVEYYKSFSTSIHKFIADFIMKISWICLIG